MVESEKEPLLVSTEVTGLSHEDVVDTKSRWRFLFSICLILLVFKGSEEMAAVTVKQFIYAWCENNTDQSDTGHTVGKPNVSDDNETKCGKAENNAQKAASQWELYFNLLYAVLAYFSCSLCGTLSDHVGRKFFFCLAIGGWMVRCGVLAAIVYFDLHIAWIFLAYGIDGICGSAYAISMVTYTCVADMTHRAHERVIGMAVMETVLGLGKLTTQFGNGYFIHDYGFFYPIFASTFGTLLALLLAITCFVETGDTRIESISDRIQNTKYGSGSTIKSNTTHKPIPSCLTLVGNYIGFYVTAGTKQDKTAFWICLTVFFLTEFGLQGRQDPLVLYQLGTPFCWSSELIGWYNALVCLVTYVMACMILKPLQQLLSDPVICCVGIISAIGFCVVTGMAQTTTWLFIAIGFGALGTLPKSILRGIASSRASSNVQGAMFAGLQSSELICKMVSSPTSLSIYSATLTSGRGFVFLVLSGIHGLSFVFMVYLTYLLKKQSKDINRAVLEDTSIENNINTVQNKDSDMQKN